MSFYTLKSDTVNYGVFIEEIPENKESIMQLSVQNRWRAFGLEYSPIVVSLGASDTGKKEFNFDICGFLSPFFIFSEKAIDELSDILLPRGEVLDIMTDSQEKKFFGYYPTNPLKNCFDREKSVYREYPNGLMIRKHSLIKDNIEDEYLFTIEEDISSVFVTDKFVERVKNSGLVGFDFSREIEVN